jgi:hypothetical protein
LVRGESLGGEKFPWQGQCLHEANGSEWSVGEGEEGGLEVMGEPLWGAGLPWGGGARACLVRLIAGICCFLSIVILCMEGLCHSTHAVLLGDLCLIGFYMLFYGRLCLSCAKYDCCSSCTRKRRPGGTDGGGEARRAGTTKDDDDKNDTIAWRRRVPNTQNDTEEPSTQPAPFKTRPRNHNI